MFQTHIARIELALRCKDELACFAASLWLTPEEAAKQVAPYVPEIVGWTLEEKQELLAASIERTMLELGKRGPSAHELTAALLDQVATGHRLVRQSALLALPKIAKLPCTECVEKLDDTLRAAEGDATQADLVLELKLLRNYFAWAGVK